MVKQKPAKPSEKAKTRRTYGLQSLSSMTEPVINRTLRDRSYMLRQILLLWPDIAGDAAPWSRPVSVNFPRNERANGTLTLAIDSGRGPEASMLTSMMISRVNAAVGYAAIARIRLQQAPNQLAGNHPTGNQPTGNQLAGNQISGNHAPTQHHELQRRESLQQTQLHRAENLERQLADISSADLKAALYRLGHKLQDDD